MILLNRAAKQILSEFILNKVLPEIVWVLGRTWVVPKGVPSFVKRGWGGRKRHSLWMLLPLLTSPYKGEESGFPLQRGGNRMALTQKPEEP
jgi:hypothetical protein